VHRGRSGFDDVKGGFYEFRDAHVSGHSRNGSSGFGDMRGGDGQRGTSELDNSRYHDGPRVPMTSEGPSGYHAFRGAHVSGHSRKASSGFDDVRDAYVHRGRSGFDDVKGGFYEFRDAHVSGHSRSGSSGFGDMRGGDERRRTSELDDSRYHDELQVHMTRQGPSGHHDFRDAHVSGHSRRGSSGLDDMRGGDERRETSELEDGPQERMTIQGPSGLHDFRDAHVSGYSRSGSSGFDGIRGGDEHRGRSEFDDVKGGNVRSELDGFTYGNRPKMPIQEPSGYHDFRDGHVSGHSRSGM